MVPIDRRRASDRRSDVRDKSGTVSAFWLLIRAHDHIITDKRWPLADRVAAAGILWSLCIRTPIGARYQP